MNPCGMVVDVLSSGYEVDCRFIENSDQLGKLYWYECQPGAKALPFPTAFCSSVWEQDRDRSGPGEVDFAGKTWVSKKGPALPGDHWHGDPSWFLHGIPADLPPLPTGAYSCTGAAMRGDGGGAGGGASPRGLLIGVGGGAGGGRGVGTGVFPRGGGAGGGRAPTTGLPYVQIGQGGGAGSGVAPQTGPSVQVGQGGGAGGGVAEQTSGGILTPCCGSIPIPRPTHWTYSGASDTDCNLSVELDYDDVNDWWISTLFTMGTDTTAQVLVRCTGTFWQMQHFSGGFPFLTLITFVADCGPPHEMVWNVTSGSWPGCGSGGPTTGTWTP